MSVPPELAVALVLEPVLVYAVFVVPRRRQPFHSRLRELHVPERLRSTVQQRVPRVLQPEAPFRAAEVEDDYGTNPTHEPTETRGC